MDCADEVAALRAELSSLPGVQELHFDLLQSKLTVAYDSLRLPVDEVVAAVQRQGMRAQLWTEPAAPAIVQQGVWRDARARATVFSGGLIALAAAIHGATRGWDEALGLADTGGRPILVGALYLAAIISGGWFIWPKATSALRWLRPDMNLLMSVAVLGALALGEYLEAATVTFLFAVSQVLESRSVGRARRAIAELMSLSPPRARVVHPDGREEQRDVTMVAIGTTILVKPGEKFPLDGLVAAGSTTVNQAPITGESMPVPKERGQEVYAGTINGDGTVEIVTTHPASDTTLARIIRLVGEAQSKRAPSEQWVERFARFYTPAVMVLALLAAIVPPVLAEMSWRTWSYNALVLLVIACPCALVISTPVSIVAALTAAARAGVLIKGGLYIELPARIRALALDKTGTVTEGIPRVQEVVPLGGHSEQEVLELAAAIEVRSQHPLARAIVERAREMGIKIAPVEDFQALQGKGAVASYAGRRVWIGSHRLLEERGQEKPEHHERLNQLAAAGASVVVVGEDDHVCGFIAVTDRVRPEAAAVIQDLRQAGIESIVLLTGDNQATAEAVGRAVGADEVYAELLPEDKVTKIETLAAHFGVVGMVGDGVNDAPALARASLGIAMGAMGSDAALETADVALMSDDLSRLPWLIRHSRRTLAVIRQNIVASLTVKAVFVVLTLSGQATLWAAIAADMGVTLVVIVNALRLIGRPAAT